MENDELPEFLQVLFNRDDDLLGDRDQLWGILSEDGTIIASGAIISIPNPDLVANIVTINGIDYTDVLTLELNGNGITPAIIFLQRNTGVIGYIYIYIYSDSTWLLE